MTLYSDSKYAVYKLEGLPLGLFGETYVIAVGIHLQDDEYKGEYFVVTQRPAPNLHSGTFSFSANGVPEEYLTVDLDFLVQECRQQAEIHLLDKLEKRSEQLNKPDLMSLQVRLSESNTKPFVGWLLGGRFHNEIKAIAQTTECQSFSKYLNAIMTMSPIIAHKR